MTSKFYSFALIFIWLAPWAAIQLFTRIPGDAAFLYSGMEMLMQGKKMSEYFYDNNPPMSFLIYAPAALLQQLGMAKHFAIQTYIMGFTLISLFITYYFLQQYKDLKITSIFIILSSYLGAVTLLSYIEYGQKDHLIAIALTPLILMQLSITNRHNIPSYILWLSILLYAPFILLKPHFGILPVTLILHRIYIAKKIRINIDFLGLAITTIAYITFTTILMPDYIDEILPASLLYYSGNYTLESLNQTTIALIIISTTLILLAKASNDKSDAKKLCEVFAWLATLSILPFWVQAKGFSLHLLPTISLMSITAGLLLHLYIKKTYITHIMILALFYTYFALTPRAPTMAEYKNSQLAKLLKEKAGSQAFFIETYTTNIISSQALYSPNAIASRFPSLWFLTNFNHLSEGKQKQTWDKYGKMIAQDIERHSPKLIGLIKPKAKDKGFLALFKNHKEFQEQFKNYKYDSEFILENGGFNEDNPEKGITYNIYLRK